MDYEKLADKGNVENSEMVRKRVQAARGRQLQRFKAMNQLHLSARAFHRVLKLARTIADLAECDVIAANYLAEAIQYRPRVGV